MSTLATNGPRELAEARIAMLREEIDAAADRAIKAALQYEIGRITEAELGQEAQAVREYLGAYNTDPGFPPPLVALVRIFERRRSFKNLARLYEAETKTAATAEDRASSLVDRGALLEDHLADPDAAIALFRQAIDAHPDGAALAALMLERSAFARGDRAAALAAIATRADGVADPTLRGMLLLEVARAREAAGDVDGALQAARQAAALPAARWRFLERLERMARRHGRLPETIAALEGRAALAAKVARGEDSPAQGSGSFSVQRFANAARAGAEAAALYREAARLRLRLGDGQGALASLGRAIALRGEDVVLLHDHMLASELVGDLDAAAEDARRLLDALGDGVVSRHAAPLHFRIAEAAQARGDAAGARAALEAARTAHPSSAVVAAMLEDLGPSNAAPDAGSVRAFVDRLGERAVQAGGAEKAYLAWRAAHLAATDLRDGVRASAFYRIALEASGDDAAAVAREWLGASLALGDAAAARDAACALLARSIDDEERSAVLRDLHEIERHVLENSAAADAVLAEALETPAAHGWALDAARLHAACAGDHALLARAHRLLAERAADVDAAAAHLCAAARALVRHGDAAGAEAALRAALERVPAHRYAVALLEEIYRARGDAEAVVRLLRDAAEADRHGKGEAQLLLAGAAAEAAGDPALAASTYEEAADRYPDAPGPLYALRRLAESRGDDALLLRALERLSEFEQASGAPGTSTLELGEHHQIVTRKPVLAEPPLRAVFERASAFAAPGSAASRAEAGSSRSEFAALDLAQAAALDLALLGTSAPAAMLDGIRGLLRSADGASRAALLRELGGIQLSLLGDRVGAEEALEQLLGLVQDEPWAPFARLMLRWRDPARARDRADAWLALADATSDAAASAELLVHGLRAAAYAARAAGEAPSDEALLRASELAETAPRSFAAAVATAEALSDEDDASERAAALARWLAHASEASAPAVRAAHGRALAAAGRGEEAVAVLREIVEREPDDLASWEALRVAARDAGAWDEVVRACDRLAEAVDGELRAQLLEEAAAVLMDHLERDDDAERRLRAALDVDPTRAIAYGRLHDMLAERGDERALLALVRGRAERVDDPERLAPLLYEIARLHRSLGDRDAALRALGDLLTLEPEHVGGLALLVELHVQREAWADAVQALRTLAAAKDLPDGQRRIARLGAADFLQKKLGDTRGALDELAAIDAMGLADFSLLERMADLAEDAGRIEVAIEALEKAARLARDPAERASIERRAARLWDERLGDEDKAIAGYRRALEALPTDVASAEALARLLDANGRKQLSASFEAAVRAALETDPTSADRLRALAMAARWRGDDALATAVLGALVALGVATDEEREALESDTEVLQRIASGGRTLSEAGFSQIRAAELQGPAMDLALAAAETLLDIDRLEPATFGFARGDAVSPKAWPPLAREIAGIAAMLGAPPGDIWIGGKDPTLLTAIPRSKPSWLVGHGVTAPLSSMNRFEVGRWACALRLGLGPYASRSPEAAATAVFGIAAAAGAPLPVGEGRAGMADATQAAARAISRRTRKAIVEIVPKVGDGRAVIALMEAAHRTFARAGLVAAGDLPGVLERVLGQAPDPSRVLASEQAVDLLRFWVSPGALAARRELGLAS